MGIFEWEGKDQSRDLLLFKITVNKGQRDIQESFHGVFSTVFMELTL